MGLGGVMLLYCYAMRRKKRRRVYEEIKERKYGYWD
jgi:hypothetical protein